jgi:hypothetical protein
MFSFGNCFFFTSDLYFLTAELIILLTSTYFFTNLNLLSLNQLSHQLLILDHHNLTEEPIPIVGILIIFSYFF